MDVEDKMYWLRQVISELSDLKHDAIGCGDVDYADDLREMIEAVDLVMNDLHELEYEE